AHSNGLAGYGSGVTTRVRGGAAGVAALEAEMSRSPGGWLTQVSPYSNVDLKSVRQGIDLQRRPLLVFAALAILPSLAFVGLNRGRQLQRESAEAERLTALGMTRRGQRGINVVRALTIAVPACAVALAVMLALSPVGPVGLARKLEYHLGLRVDVV